MNYLITKWFGSFLCDEHGIKKKIIFPNDEAELLKRLQHIQDQKILSEEKKLTKTTPVVVSEKRLASLGTYDPINPVFTSLQITAQEHGFSQETFHRISHTLASQKVETKLHAEDLQVIQMIDALDDLLHIQNLLLERTSHWSLIPTPEEKRAPFEHLVTMTRDEINRLENQITTDMSTVAPNITRLIGPLIAARLLSRAGSLERLATFPASTVQILGAEKALFRFKKEGGKPPKHGVIFQHPLLNKAPHEERGRIARLIAGKLSIAAKADMYTKRNIAEQLQKDLEEQLSQIHKKKH